MPGIYVTRGSTFRIPAFSIDFENPELTTISPEIGIDVYPLWLQSCMIQARQAKSASAELAKVWDGEGTKTESEFLEREIIASMLAIVSAAAAIDAFYGSVIGRCPHSPISQEAKGKNRKRAREKVILATFQQRFGLKNEVLSRMRQPFKDIFAFRHSALHANGQPEPAVEHPRLKVGMSRKQVVFRAENADVAATAALSSIAFLCTRPSRRYPELREHCTYAREWLNPLVADWGSDHPELGIPLPLEERK